MLAAPNKMKQPNITTAPCRQLIRPVSIKKPTEAIAITAATVATVPSNVPCIQRIALTTTPEPCGSVESSWAKAEVEKKAKQIAAIDCNGRTTDRIMIPLIADAVTAILDWQPLFVVFTVNYARYLLNLQHL